MIDNIKKIQKKKMSGIDDSIHYIDFVASIITVCLFLGSVYLYFKSKKKEDKDIKDDEKEIKKLSSKIDRLLELEFKTSDLKL